MKWKSKIIIMAKSNGPKPKPVPTFTIHSPIHLYQKSNQIRNKCSVEPWINKNEIYFNFLITFFNHQFYEDYFSASLIFWNRLILRDCNWRDEKSLSRPLGSSAPKFITHFILARKRVTRNCKCMYTSFEIYSTSRVSFLS